MRSLCLRCTVWPVRPSPFRSRATRTPGYAALQLLLLSGLAVFGYRMVFGRFALYDDQGNMMMTLRLWLQGHRLYDDIPTPYGPCYYFVQRLIYGIFRVPLTTDNTRWMCLGGWLVTSCLVGVLTYRLTRQLVLSLLTQAVLFFFLCFLTSEPSHPQEQLLVEIGSLLLLATCGRRPGWTLAGMGALCAAMLLTKVNVGLFAVAACGMALLTVTDLGRANAVTKAAAAAVVLAIPIRLMGPWWGSDPWTGFTVSQCASIAALTLVCFSRRHGDAWRPWRPWRMLAFCAGFFALTAVAAVLLLSCGSSFHGLYQSTWELPQRQLDAFLFYPLMARNSALWSLLATAPAVLLVTPASERAIWRRCPAAVSLAKLLAGAYALTLLVPGWDTIQTLPHLPPLTWLLLVRCRPAADAPASTRHDFPRLTLAWMAVLQTMWIFPVGGTQRFPAALFPAMALIVCFGDGVTEIRAWLPNIKPPMLALGTLAVFAATAQYASLFSTLKSYDNSYRQGTPINLPGATRTRTNSETAADLRHLARALRDHCDTFLASDGLNSLYFWTGQQPPTTLVMSHPLEYFTPQQQTQLLVALEAHPRSCFVVEETGFPHASSELAGFIDRARRAYKPWCRIGFCELLIRADRPLPPLPEGGTVLQAVASPLIATHGGRRGTRPASH